MFGNGEKMLLRLCLCLLIGCTDQKDKDIDRDGYSSNQGDCDDMNNTIGPHAEEICDDIDNNCDGEVDEESAIDVVPWFVDADGDGVGTPQNPIYACYQPDGTSTLGEDCDDNDSTVYLGAPELCDGISNNCEAVLPSSEVDADGDGFVACETDGVGWRGDNVIQGGNDCNDDDEAISPISVESCDGIDNNCDGNVDEYGLFYADSDGDGFGDENMELQADCPTPPSGYVDNPFDCDDSDQFTGSKLNDADCDGVITDEDCDDENPNAAFTTNDADCDGVHVNQDCDDNDISLLEQSNDNDCDGVVSSEDCDDNDISLLEQSNDNDCDGSLMDEDCDDADPTVGNHSNDNDCDGVVSSEDCDDADAATVNDMDCDGVLSDDDCNDFNQYVWEITVDDMDCDGVFHYEDCDDLEPLNMQLCVPIGGGIEIVLADISDVVDPLGRYVLSNDFHIMTTEVTQGMFYQLMEYHSYAEQNTSNISGSYGVGNEYPGYWVSWHMAADYANHVTDYVNAQNGVNLSPCYSCNNSGEINVTCSETMDPYDCDGYSLPTESEWEIAARSGTTAEFWTGGGSHLGGDYLGDDCNSSVVIEDDDSNPLLSDYAWFTCNNDPYGSKEVGQKLPNGFGLFDMHGNIWEWTADSNGCSFPQSDGSWCDFDPSYRVLRGGSWGGNIGSLRVSYRINGVPDARNRGIGFRLRKKIP